MYDPQTASEINQLRAKLLAGTITRAELQQGIHHMRQNRMSAAASSAAKRTPRKKEPINVDKLFDDLEKL